MIVRALVLTAAMSSVGCGLTLDYAPPEPDTSVLGGLDGGAVRVDAGDASRRDGGEGRDAEGIDGSTELDANVDDGGNVMTLDAEPIADATGPFDATTDDAGGLDAALDDDASAPDVGPPDAGPPDAGPPDAGPPDSGPPDAGRPDAGPPDAGRIDAGNDASMVVCMGVHPIIGPPRSCNPGSCLCVDIDACFTADVVRFCCTGTFVCAPPPTTCNAQHPIVGPPRTCPSGNCYCSNPDACFPADRASSCCGVDVVCVP